MALGTLRVPLKGWQYFTVTGGPFLECPSTMQGVKMAGEIRAACTIDIPTRDFMTPNREALDVGLTKAVRLVLAGQPLYVGCMGGKGRTGLFLAVLAKAFGVEQPVEYVRANYYRHAVETAEQYDFVKRFLINPDIRSEIAEARRWWWVKFWRTNRTNLPPVIVATVEDRKVFSDDEGDQWDDDGPDVEEASEEGYTLKQPGPKKP